MIELKIGIVEDNSIHFDGICAMLKQMSEDDDVSYVPIPGNEEDFLETRGAIKSTGCRVAEVSEEAKSILSSTYIGVEAFVLDWELHGREITGRDIYDIVGGEAPAFYFSSNPDEVHSHASGVEVVQKPGKANFWHYPEKIEPFANALHSVLEDKL